MSISASVTSGCAPIWFVIQSQIGDCVHFPLFYYILLSSPSCRLAIYIIARSLDSPLDPCFSGDANCLLAFVAPVLHNQSQPVVHLILSVGVTVAYIDGSMSVIVLRESLKGPRRMVWISVSAESTR